MERHFHINPFIFFLCEKTLKQPPKLTITPKPGPKAHHEPDDGRRKRWVLGNNKKSQRVISPRKSPCKVSGHKTGGATILNYENQT